MWMLVLPYAVPAKYRDGCDSRCKQQSEQAITRAIRTQFTGCRECRRFRYIAAIAEYYLQLCRKRTQTFKRCDSYFQFNPNQTLPTRKPESYEFWSRYTAVMPNYVLILQQARQTLEWCWVFLQRKSFSIIASSANPRTYKRIRQFGISLDNDKSTTITTIFHV